jgi:hypothetical protein
LRLCTKIKQNYNEQKFWTFFFIITLHLLQYVVYVCAYVQK